MVNTLRARSRGEQIADDIGRALLGDAWHGPALNELLAGVSAEDAVQRPIAAAHNIWELGAAHNVVVSTSPDAALREARSSRWRVRIGRGPRPISENRWADARAALAESHERLREIVAGMSDDDLARNAPQSEERSVAAMLHGVTQHAAYHGGQNSALSRKRCMTAIIARQPDNAASTRHTAGSLRVRSVRRGLRITGRRKHEGKRAGDDILESQIEEIVRS